MWQPGDVVTWRGIYRKRVWHAQTVISEIILREWTREIDIAKKEILDKLEQRQYPYDGSWLNWLPDPSWSPPKLPEIWDKI
jgi:hypothetical protein